MQNNDLDCEIDIFVHHKTYIILLTLYFLKFKNCI